MAVGGATGEAKLCGIRLAPHRGKRSPKVDVTAYVRSGVRVRAGPERAQRGGEPVGLGPVGRIEGP